MRYLRFLVIMFITISISNCIPTALPPPGKGFIPVGNNTLRDPTLNPSVIEPFKEDPKTNYQENIWVFTKDNQGNNIQIGFPKTSTKDIRLYMYKETISSIPSTVGDIMTDENRKIFKTRGISPDTPITTWILFLIPNSALYLQDELLMKEFWHQFVNLGNRIGDVSCTIWFTTKDCKTEEKWKCYNAEIAERDYIERFIHTDELAPYVLITTNHPQKCSENDEAYVLYLKGIHVKYYSEILRKLTGYIDNNYEDKRISVSALRLLEKKYWVPSQFFKYVFFVKKFVKEIIT